MPFNLYYAWHKNDKDANFFFLGGRRIAKVMVAILNFRALSKVHVKQKPLDQI